MAKNTDKEAAAKLKLIYDALPSDPELLKIIRGGVKELAADMEEAKRLKERQAESAAEICNAIKEQTGFSPANLKKLAKIHVEQNADQAIELAEDAKEAYKQVYKA